MFLQDQGQSEMQVEDLDPDSYLHIINAFECLAGIGPLNVELSKSADSSMIFIPLSDLV